MHGGTSLVVFMRDTLPPELTPSGATLLEQGMRRRCEALVFYRTVLWLNAVVLPKYYECPRWAEEGSKFCLEHAHLEER
jgi:hypothetical protein